MNWLEAWNVWVSGGAVPIALALVGGYFTLRLRHVWLHPVRLARRMIGQRGQGGVSPLRAMSLSLAGVLGVGNLVGVASAILYGGAGAILWMWISAALAMMLKYAEVVLALRHRRRVGDRWEGCAMYYIEDSFSRSGRTVRPGRWLGGIFAILLMIDAVCMGCMIQVNAISTAFGDRLGLSPIISGLFLAGIVLVVGMRGDDRVSSLAGGLVPLMSVGFCILTLLALIRGAACVPDVLREIVVQGTSFGTGRGVLGGVGAFFLSRALRYGTMRGLLSNEAGCGTSPMAHADSQTDDPVVQGGMGILEVFVDTHLLCSATALVILAAYHGEELPAFSPMTLTLSAFERLLGRGAGMFLTVAVLCFGLATVLCWAHYWQRTGAYLFPAGQRSRFERVRDALLLLIYSFFTLVGACAAPTAVWELSDFAIGLMTLLNLLILWRDRREIFAAGQPTIAGRAQGRK